MTHDNEFQLVKRLDFLFDKAIKSNTSEGWAAYFYHRARIEAKLRITATMPLTANERAAA